MNRLIRRCVRWSAFVSSAALRRACRLAVCLLCCSLPAAAQNDRTSLSNQNVIQMVNQGMPEKEIIETIESRPAAFDVSPAALIGLKQMGVAPSIMNAMLAAAKRSPAAAPVGSAPAPTSSSLGQSFPLTFYRLDLLTIRDNPNLPTDAGLARFTANQINIEQSSWKDLDSNVASQSRRRRTPVYASAWEWDKFLAQDPEFARGPLEDVFLREDANWSFVKNPADSIVMAFVFSRREVEGRQPEFAAHELMPIARQQLQLAASKVATDLWFTRELPVSDYDFASQSLRFPSAERGIADILRPVYDPHSTAPQSRTDFDELPDRAHTQAAMWLGMRDPDLPELKPGFPGNSPDFYWRTGTSFLELPHPTVLSLDRELRLTSIPMAPELAERVKAMGNPIRAKVYIKAEQMQLIHQIHPERKNGPETVLFARLQKVEILNRKDEVVLTLPASHFQSGKEFASQIPPAPAPAPARAAAQDNRSFQEKMQDTDAANRRNAEASREQHHEVAEERLAYNKKRLKCRQGARKVNSDANSDEYKNAYDACMKED